MRNSMSVVTTVTEKCIFYTYNIEGPWAEAFNLEGVSSEWFRIAGNGVHDFFVEYDEEIGSVPESIAVIPFIANVLPVAWLYDAEVSVPELDEDFYNSVNGFKRGYIGMYPNASFKGKLTPQKLVRNKLRNGNERSLAFFSGGVDAHYTVLENLDQKPLLVTIWGSDLFFTQEEAWHAVSARNRKTADNLALAYTSIKTSFRLFLNYEVLDRKFVKPNAANSWWYGFQQGIGLLSHAAPLAYKRGIEKIFIASSYSIKDDQNTKCASWPTIDEFFRFSDCLLRHHDFFVTRQEKIKKICGLSKGSSIHDSIPVHLRVCWEAYKADNCCECEKCVRTMFAILAEGFVPSDFGFRWDIATMQNIAARIDQGTIRPSKFWGAIVDKLSDNRTGWKELPPVASLIKAYERFKIASAV